jgi:hypothetical protein
MQRGVVASRTLRSIVDEMLWAQFQFAPSVCSVKVVRHKLAEYFVRGCGKVRAEDSPDVSGKGKRLYILLHKLPVGRVVRLAG